MATKAFVQNDQACDICQAPLKRGPHFYDAATMRGWGWLCQSCFVEWGYGLGQGRGQQYDSKTNEKVAG